MMGAPGFGGWLQKKFTQMFALEGCPACPFLAFTLDSPEDWGVNLAFGVDVVSISTPMERVEI